MRSQSPRLAAAHLADDESSSKHRPLVSADDAIVASPPRMPLGAAAGAHVTHPSGSGADTLLRACQATHSTPDGTPWYSHDRSLWGADDALERAPLPSEGSISISLAREESATAQSAVTEQLAHLSTAPKRMPLQSQPRTSTTAAAPAGPVPMVSSSSKPARKQSQEAQPVFDAEWDDDNAVPDDKRLFTVSCRVRAPS